MEVMSDGPQAPTLPEATLSPCVRRSKLFQVFWGLVRNILSALALLAGPVQLRRRAARMQPVAFLAAERDKMRRDARRQRTKGAGLHWVRRASLVAEGPDVDVGVNVEYRVQV